MSMFDSVGRCRRAFTATRISVGLLLLVVGGVASFATASAEEIGDSDPENLLTIGHVQFHQKISETSGGFTGIFNDSDLVGFSVASAGDVDGDGTADLVAGAPQDDDGAFDAGAVWILFLHPNGTVKSHQKISDFEGGFTGVLDNADIFGSGVTSVGDLDGDGTPDLAVGAGRDDDGGTDRGAVWILFLHPNGTVKSHQKISATEGGFTGAVTDDSWLGFSVRSIGDLNGDGTIDLAAGAWMDDDDGANRGAVWILFLNPDGTVASHQKISGSEGGFTGGLSDGDEFGYDLAPLGDLNNDGTPDLAVSARRDEEGGPDQGAVWVLFLNPNGTVASHQKINSVNGGFTGTLEDSGLFGIGMDSVPDLNCDGIRDLAVGQLGSDGGPTRGAVWILFLNENGTVKLHTKISDTSGGFTGALADNDEFGRGLAYLGDLNGDGFADLAAGAPDDDDGGSDRGAVWNLFLNGSFCPNPPIFTDGFETGDTTRWSTEVP